MPEHVSLGLTAQQSADRRAQTFADISQEYPGLYGVPKYPVYEKSREAMYFRKKLIASKIEIAKNTKAGVEGALPIKLSELFSEEHAVPAAKIFNKIDQKGEWPARWKIEKGIPFNKVKPKQPESESHLRIISLTPFLSKNFEIIVFD